MFRNCSNFQIIGGVFIGHPESRSSRTRRAVANPSFLANFHRVRLGDLELISEIGKEEIVEYHEVRRRKTGALIRRKKVVVGERRRFEVSVSGRTETLTAVVYKDTNIDQWRIEVEKHETCRHPSLVQLYAVTVSRALNALIYTDALIPLCDVRELHANSPLASTYVEYGIKRDLYAALEYWSDTTGVWLLSPGSPKYTLWIRAATGRLCIKIGDSFPDIIHLDVKSLVRDPLSRATSLGYLEADLGQKIISKLQLDDIHVLLCSRFYEMAEVTLRSGNVTLGTIWPTSDVAKVIPCPSLLSFSTTITREDIIQKPWWYWENGLRKPSNSKDVIRNGWTRITLPPNMQKAHHLTTHVKIQRSKRREMQKCWLSQANLIGRDHGIAVKDYWIPAGAKFRVSIWCPEDNFTLHGTFMADAPTSEIYLFVFKPAVGFVGGYPVIEFPHVRDALYWSFDSRGRTRLTAEMAERIGVPYVFFESWVTGISWSQKDYDTLAEFHSAKGCDPFSCDVTVKLGYPILEHKVAAHTSLSEIDQDEVEYAKRELKTYPKQVSRCATVRCPDCGGRQLAVQNVVLPDIEVPPIHRHRHYRNVFIRTDTTLAA